MDRKLRVKRRLRELDVLTRAVENLRIQAELSPAEREALLRRRRYLKQKLRALERALEVLTPEERLVVELLDIRPGKGNADRLCQVLQVEVASVYRRRERAMRKLSMALYGYSE